MTLITTFLSGHLAENKVVIHSSREDAAAYGLEIYGYGKFTIKTYSTWKKSKIARYELIRIATLQKLRRFVKPSAK